jgi:hypothetical protein
VLGWNGQAAAASFREARALARAEGDRWVEGYSLVWEGLVAPLLGDIDGGLALTWEGQSILREAGDDWGVGMSLVGLVALSISTGHLDDAERYAGDHLALAQRMGDQRGVAHAYDCLGLTAVMRDDRDRALPLLTAALVKSIEVGHVELVAHVVMDLAVLASRVEHTHAARLFGVSEALREDVGVAIWPSRRPVYDQAQRALRDILGEAQFAVAWKEGRATTPERGLEYALQHDATLPHPELTA